MATRFHLRRFHRDSPDAEWVPDPRYDDGSHDYRSIDVAMAVFRDFRERWPNYDFIQVVTENTLDSWVGTPRSGDGVQIKFAVVML